MILYRPRCVYVVTKLCINQSDVHTSSCTHTDIHTLSTLSRTQEENKAWNYQLFTDRKLLVWAGLATTCALYLLLLHSQHKLGWAPQNCNKIRPKSGLSQLWLHQMRKSMRTSRTTADALTHSTHVLPWVFAGGVIRLGYRELFTSWPHLNANQHQREEVVSLVVHSLTPLIEIMVYMYVVVGCMYIYMYMYMCVI